MSSVASDIGGPAIGAAEAAELVLHVANVHDLVNASSSCTAVTVEATGSMMSHVHDHASVVHDNVVATAVHQVRTSVTARHGELHDVAESSASMTGAPCVVITQHSGGDSPGMGCAELLPCAEMHVWCWMQACVCSTHQPTPRCRDLKRRRSVSSARGAFCEFSSLELTIGMHRQMQRTLTFVRGCWVGVCDATADLV